MYNGFTSDFRKDYFEPRKPSQKQSSSLPPGSREERKRIVYVSHPVIPERGIRYRLCYTIHDGCDPGNEDILKIEISYDLENLVHYVKKILDLHRFWKLRVYVRYSEFLKLHDGLEKINRDLFTCNYRFRFSFIPDNYKDSEYVPLYEIEGIKRGEHRG